MLDWYEFVAKEHQRDLLREARRRHLIQRLQAARWGERSRVRNIAQKGFLRETRHQGDPCPGSGGF